MPRKKKGGIRGDSPEKSYPPSFSGLENPNIPNTATFPNYNVQSGNIMANRTDTSWVDVARQGIGENQGGSAMAEDDQTFLRLQEMFKGKLEPEVIHMVLVESQWKVNEAIEKLFILTSESDSEHRKLDRQQGVMFTKSNQSYEPANLKSRLPSRVTLESTSSGQLPMLSPKTPSDISPSYSDVFVSSNQHVKSGMQALDSYGSRLTFKPSAYAAGQQSYVNQQPPAQHPLSTNDPVGPMMYGHYKGSSYQGSENRNVYRNNPDEQNPNFRNQFAHSTASVPPSQITPYKLGTSSAPSTNFAQTVLSTALSHHHEEAFPKLVHVDTSDTTKLRASEVTYSHDIPQKEITSKMGNTHTEQKNLAKKRGRKTTMSLNPEEREALENLIEDVIIGGIGVGVIDSEESASSSTESEEDCKTQTEASSSDAPKDEDMPKSDIKCDGEKKDKDGSGKNKQPKDAKKEGQKGFEQGQKVYPPQLKVAVKHMKNLPPRFLRKIQTNKDDKLELDIDGKPKRIRETTIPEVVEPKEMKPFRPEILPRKREEPPAFAKEKVKSKEEQMIEKKRKVRGMLLEGLDHYFEQSVDSDEKKQDDNTPVGESGSQLTTKPLQNTENFSHSAPSSAQVSPNANLTLHQKTPSVDLSPMDPAIKAQGPMIGHQIRPVLQVPVSRIQQPRIIGSQPGGQISMPRPPIYLQPNAVNCEELEREMFNKSGGGCESHESQRLNVSQQQPNLVHQNSMSTLHTGMQQISLAQLTNHGPPPPIMLPAAQHHHHHAQQTAAAMAAMQHQQQARSQFSVDAPEFIPRAFTPGTLSNLGHPADMMIATAGPQTPPQLTQQQALQHMQHLPPSSVQQPPPQPPQQNTLQAPLPPQQQNTLQSTGQPVTGVSIGRISPNMQAMSTVSTSTMLTQGQQLVSMAGQHAMVGRNSPVPGGPTYILPKVAPNVHTAGVVPPQPGGPPGMGLVYAPMPPTAYPPQFPAAGYPASYHHHHHQLQGPFLVQAWSGGRKNHTQQFHQQSSHPASRHKHNPLSGMVHKGHSESSGASVKGHHSLATSKLPHRNQHEMTPQQAKEKVQTIMKQGKKVMAILRGLPGSGKSTIAKEIQENGIVLSTDDFFMRGDVFEYNFAKLSDAHEWNQKRAKEAIEKGSSPIVIDNTNTQAWEMRAYVALALRYDYHIEIIEPSTAWKFKVKDLAEKNVHSVPVETIQKMLDRYEKSMSIEKIMGQADRKKDEAGDKQPAPDDDPDSERKTPRRKRRRRRRRKKKTSTEVNSDSEKAEDERSSDEESVTVKKETLMLSVLSTDTTENEQERAGTDTNMGSQSMVELVSLPLSAVQRSGGSKISSSSMDSEDLAAVFQAQNSLHGVTDVMNQLVFDHRLSQHAEMMGNQSVRPPSSSNEILPENLPMPGDNNKELVTQSPGDNGNLAESRLQGDKTGILLNNEQEGNVKNSSVAESDKGITSETVAKESIENFDKETKCGAVIMGTIVTLNNEDVKCEPVSIETLGSNETVGGRIRNDDQVKLSQVEIGKVTELSSKSVLELESVNRMCAEVHDGENMGESIEKNTAEKVNELRTVVTSELESYIRDHIVETWINEELNKLIGSGKNGFTLGKESGLKGKDSSNCNKPSENEFVTGAVEDNWEIVDLKEAANNNTECCPGPLGEESLNKQDSGIIRGEAVNSPKHVTDNGAEETCDAGHPLIVTSFLDTEKKYWNTEILDESDCYRVGSHCEKSEDNQCGFIEVRGSESVAIETGKSSGGHVVCAEDSRSESTVSDADQSSVLVKQEQRTPKRKQMEVSPDPWLSETHTSGESVKTEVDPVKPLDIRKNGQSVIRASLDKVSVETQTFATDFSAIQKLLQGAKDPELLRQFQLKTTRVRDVFNPNYYVSDMHDSGGSSSSKESSPSRNVKLMLHKGCMTDTEEIKEGIGFLHACFPSVPREDLQDILDKCVNDTEWAVNILLDSGFVYCDPTTQTEGNIEVTTEEVTGEIEQFESQESKLKENSLVVLSDNEDTCGETEVLENQGVNSLGGLLDPGEVAIGNTSNSSDENEAENNGPPPLFLLCHKFINRELDSTLMEQVSRQRLKRASLLERVEKGDIRPPLFCIGDDENSGEICDKTVPQGKDGVLLLNTVESSGLDSIREYIDSDDGKTEFASKEDSVSGQTLEMFACDRVEPERVMEDVLETSEDDKRQKMGLNLSLDLAVQLIDQFGPVGFHISPESLSKEDLEVELSSHVARQVHHLWARTMQQRFSAEEAAIEIMRRDEELARKLQAEEDFAYTSTLAGDSHVASEKSSNHSLPPVVGLGSRLNTIPSPVRKRIHDSPSLKEIMEEERAIELSKKDYEQQEYGELENTLSTKLKRQKLHQLYPHIDSTALDDIFNMNGYSLEVSVRLIDGGYGQKQPVQTVMTAEEQARLEEQLLQKALKASQNDLEWLGIEGMDDFDGNCMSSKYQSFGDPTYQNYRAEASLHYKLRHECFEKAQEAYRRGMKAVASFYSQQGHIHSEKLKEANKRAAEKIMEQRNKHSKETFTIDLHGLHVDEALHVLEKKLTEQEHELRMRKDKRLQHLSVVTGQGKHSREGKARIKPAVMEFLKSKKYRFQEMQPGVLRVDIK